MLIRISLVAGSRPGALIPRGGWGSFLFPGGRRTFRAGILNRAKFAEWLREGLGNGQYLYSDQNYHLAKRDTRRQQTSPRLVLPGSPPFISSLHLR